MPKTEFKYVLSYEKASKNYGNGEGIHVTVRSDSFQEAYDELRGEVMTKMVHLIGQGEKIAKNANKAFLEVNRELGEIASSQSMSGVEDPSSTPSVKNNGASGGTKGK